LCASHMLTVNNTCRVMCTVHVHIHTYEPSNYSWLDYSYYDTTVNVVLDGSGICQALTIWLELCMSSDCNKPVLTIALQGP